MSASSYLEKKTLGYIYSGEAFASPNATLYLALFKSDPTQGNEAGHEVDVVTDDTAYVRQAITFATPIDAVQAVGLDPYEPAYVKASNAQVFTPMVQGSNGVDFDITHVGIYDATTGGNLTDVVKLAGIISRVSGQATSFPIGNVKISLD